MNHGTLHTPVCDFEPIFFSFPVLPAAAKTTHPIWGLSFILLLFQYIYHCIKIRVQQHKIIICLFLLYLLVKLTPCRFSFVGSHRSNSHSCVSSPQDSCQEWKKGLEKHRGLFWSRPLSPCPTAALIIQQETTAECRKWRCMHSLQEVECMPSRYSQGCNLWNNLCHCIKKKINYQVFFCLFVSMFALKIRIKITYCLSCWIRSKLTIWEKQQWFWMLNTSE